MTTEKITKPYCGIGKIPKGKHRGSMVECAELGKISYYGIKKIDARLLENCQQQKANSKDNSLQNLRNKQANLIGKIKGLARKFKEEDNITEKKKLKTLAEKANNELTLVKTKLLKLTKEQTKEQNKKMKK